MSIGIEAETTGAEAEAEADLWIGGIIGTLNGLGDTDAEHRSMAFSMPDCR